MPKPRVFISHSAKETHAEALRTALAKALNDAGYPVLLDKDELQLGVNWRATLNVWIDGCDAAVVLLSESALQSAFVAYEASILAYRKRANARFLLIPVFVDPVDNKKVQHSPLAPTRIHDVESITKDVPQDQLIQQVLEKMAEHEAITAVDGHTKHLTSLLEDVPDFALEEEGERLGINLGAWVPASELKLALAMKMMGAGLDGAATTVMNLDSYLPEPRPKTAGEIADLVGASWVDSRSVDAIPKVAKGSRAVGVNGDNPLTAKMYVIRACPRPPSNRFRWRVAEVDGVVGEYTAATIKPLCQLIRQSLMHTLKADDEDELEEALEDLVDRDDPIFVVLPAVTRDVLDAVRGIFPTVTFFLLLGAQQPDLALLKQARVQYLEPDLDNGQEKHFCKLYRRKKKVLTQTD